MYQCKVKVMSNKEVAPSHFKMALLAPKVAQAAQPGQFINVRCGAGCEPLLRRPFSIHRVRGRRSGERSQIEILYKVVGKGTKILSQKKPGEALDIIGPLGNGFTLPDAKGVRPHLHFKYKRGLTPFVLAAGGIGVAPLLFLAEAVARKQRPPHASSPLRGEEKGEGELTVIIGAKTKNLLLCEEEFKKLGAKVIVATEDGSKGKRGLASEILVDILQNRPSSIPHRPSLRGTRHEGRGTIYACGPREMLKAVSKVATKNKIPCQVSLEEHMACGIGACLGCAVRIQPSAISHQLTAESRKLKAEIYKRVCADGPVFDASEIVW